VGQGVAGAARTWRLMVEVVEEDQTPAPFAPTSDFQRVAQAYLSQQRADQHDEPQEGFTRSISLYWHWVRGQKAASRVGKVSRHHTALGSVMARQASAHAAARRVCVCPGSPCGTGILGGGITAASSAVRCAAHTAQACRHAAAHSLRCCGVARPRPRAARAVPWRLVGGGDASHAHTTHRLRQNTHKHTHARTHARTGPDAQQHCAHPAV
jgi:hypothetical protein